MSAGSKVKTADFWDVDRAALALVLYLGARVPRRGCFPERRWACTRVSVLRQPWAKAKAEES